MTLKKSEINILAGRYAKALYEAASEAKSVDKVAKDVASIQLASLESEEFQSLLVNPLFSKDDRLSAVTKISAKNKFNKLTENTLKVLSVNGRLEILSEVCKNYLDIISAQASVIKAEVTSAKKLKAAEVKKIADSLGKATGKKVDCETKIDESIIGGLKIKIGSKLFDDSIAGKLENLKLQLAN